MAMHDPTWIADKSIDAPGDVDTLAPSLQMADSDTARVSCAKWNGMMLAAIVTLVLLAYVSPVARCFMRLEINYNEGWNAYNARIATAHSLFSAKPTWTVVNYPFLSFFIIGQLAKIFGDPLYVGRVMSLLGLLLFSFAGYCIVRKLTGHHMPAIYSAVYCLWAILVISDGYIASNDPQMLAQAVILGAFYLYIKSNKSNSSLVLVALLFIIGGNIKHNLVAAPLAVFVDLIVISRRKALWYSFWGILLGCGSVMINQWLEGPFYWAHVLAPRTFSFAKMLSWPAEIFTIAIPLSICAVWSTLNIRDATRRIVNLYFLLSFVAGFVFFGGHGASKNMFFDGFMAISIIMGLILDSLWHSKAAPIQISNRYKWVAPLLLWQIACSSYPPVHFNELRAKQMHFDSGVAFLKAQGGPAICEDLLQCYFAGKPYVYDPFNSTSMVDLKLVDPKPMIQRIKEHDFGAIQFDSPIAAMSRPNDHFPNEILDAIAENYRIGKESGNSFIYVPR